MSGDEEDDTLTTTRRVNRGVSLVGRLTFTRDEPMQGVEPGQWIDVPEGAVVVVGRSENCTVTLPSPRLSRRHARLFTGQLGWCIQDLDSTNGVYVNGKRVVTAWLTEGDEVRLAALPFRFSVVVAGGAADSIQPITQRRLQD